MKNILTIAIFFFTITGFAQIKGNGKIISKTFSLDKIEAIKINLYAKVNIDCKAENGVTIQTDENLIGLIDKTVNNGQLHLSQKKWIQASQNIKITIGAPFLQQIETGTHDVTFLKNINNENLTVIAPIGTLTLSGKTENLALNAKNASVDASKLIAENGIITITGSSKSIVNVLNVLTSLLSKNARFQLVNTPKKWIRDTNNLTKKVSFNDDIKWINIKIKNNSWNRNKLVVVGFKKDGSQFSYGFAMMPGASKNERWTTGTKIYKEKKLGNRILLVTITKEDENKVVKLFD